MHNLRNALPLFNIQQKSFKLKCSQLANGSSVMFNETKQDKVHHRFVQSQGNWQRNRSRFDTEPLFGTYLSGIHLKAPKQAKNNACNNTAGLMVT